MMVTPVYVLVRELGFVCPCAAARGVCVCWCGASGYNGSEKVLF